MSEEPRVYLLDVEGTVAPIAMVAEVLFPYARAHLRNFLLHHRNDAQVAEDLALLAGERRAETDPLAPEFTGREDPQQFIMSALMYLHWLMDRDRKSTALKSLQGRIWKTGFESGELKGEVYPDVPTAIEKWSKFAKVAIYSSGSVEAQRLFFTYSTYGDLTPLISNYFDTRTGPKLASASYRAIAMAMQVEPGEILFFSDVTRELDAAREAGCGTRLVVREGNAAVEDDRGHMRLASFEGL